MQKLTHDLNRIVNAMSELCEGATAPLIGHLATTWKSLYCAANDLLVDIKAESGAVPPSQPYPMDTPLRQCVVDSIALAEELESLGSATTPDREAMSAAVGKLMRGVLPAYHNAALGWPT